MGPEVDPALVGDVVCKASTPGLPGAANLGRTAQYEKARVVAPGFTNDPFQLGSDVSAPSKTRAEVDPHVRTLENICRRGVGISREILQTSHDEMVCGGPVTLGFGGIASLNRAEPRHEFEERM